MKIIHKPNYKEAKTTDKRAYKKIDFQIDQEQKNVFHGKTYYLKTYGCQMNEHDSENIKAILEELGFHSTDCMEEADLVLLNTCSIRENAHNKAFGMLGRLKHLKETKKDVLVGLCGCMAQEEGVIDEILHKYKWVNFVFGTHNINRLPDLLLENMRSHEQQIEVFSREQDLIEHMPVKRDNPYKAYVNIIYGCDKFCTYCIVPYTRGRQRSRAKEDILEEIKNLQKDHYQEVILLGQNVNAYGKDLYENYKMENLLEDVAKTGIPRIRFVTSHPWDFTDQMIEVMKKYKNIMPAIHLPVQSGCNRILKLMGRRYTKEEYLKLFYKLKEIPNIAISTDIIVGFPGESEEDFQETLDLCKTCKFDNAYTFIYSARENTPASKLIDHTSLKEKEDRLQRLNAVVNTYFKESNERLLNKEVEVLVEGVSDKKNNYFGYTDTNKLINFTGEHVPIGSIIKVRVLDAKTWSLDGKAV